MSKKYFLKGSIIGLRAPDLNEDIDNGDWHEWFNSLSTTKYLEHGIYPNTLEAQREFVSKEITNDKTLMFSIDRLDTEEHIGVISLKNINLIQRNAEIGLVIGKKIPKGGALEAMSIMTMHGFERLNLKKIYAGQHEGLWKWVNTLALIGYRIEGIRSCMGEREGKRYNIILTGINYNEYKNITKIRSGDLIGEGGASNLVNQRSNINISKKMENLINEFHNENYLIWGPE